MKNEEWLRGCPVPSAFSIVILQKLEKIKSRKKMRSLTLDEIEYLENNGCRAEDWSGITVAEDFSPKFIRDVFF